MYWKGQPVTPINVKNTFSAKISCDTICIVFSGALRTYITFTKFEERCFSLIHFHSAEKEELSIQMFHWQFPVGFKRVHCLHALMPSSIAYLAWLQGESK